MPETETDNHLSKDKQDHRLELEGEDTFPASDAPSMSSPITGSGHKDVSDLPDDFKDNKQAQFEYGRRSQLKTQHFDTSSRRLTMGNPDIGEVDLGTIEADEPAQPDDHDSFDEPAKDTGGGFDEATDGRER